MDNKRSIEAAFNNLPAGDFWVFAYGSLMWRPDFAYTEKRQAKLTHYERSLCVWSWHHRGTRTDPGLVFGLDWTDRVTTFCEGCVYHVEKGHRDETLQKLQTRELITNIYQTAIVQVQTDKGAVSALAFIVDQYHAQYAGKLELESSLGIVRNATGKSGSNLDYVISTCQYLQACGIEDEHLCLICERLNLS